MLCLVDCGQWGGESKIGRIHEVAYFDFSDIEISGISVAVPKNIVEVNSFSKTFGAETVRKYERITGITRFRKSLEHQTASDLGCAAAENLIEKLNVNRNDIDGLVFISQSHDYLRPATACVLHKRLGFSKNCVAFDVNLGCSGFVYGVQLLASMMSSSSMKKALVIVAETSTKVVWPRDKSLAMLFGDSGSAILLERKEKCHIRGALFTDGKRFQSIIIPAGGFRMPKASKEPFVGSDGNEHNLHYQCMNGLDIMHFSITDVPKSIGEFFSHYNTDVRNYDIFALHQANAFIVKQLIKRLSLPKDKVPMVLGKFGNVGGVSIPLVLCDTYGETQSGKKINVFSCGFGIGLSWGLLDFRVSEDAIFPVVETEEVFNEGIYTSFDF